MIVEIKDGVFIHLLKSQRNGTGTVCERDFCKFIDTGQSQYIFEIGTFLYFAFCLKGYKR